MAKIKLKLYKDKSHSANLTNVSGSQRSNEVTKKIPKNNGDGCFRYFEVLSEEGLENGKAYFIEDSTQFNGNVFDFLDKNTILINQDKIEFSLFKGNEEVIDHLENLNEESEEGGFTFEADFYEYNELYENLIRFYNEFFNTNDEDVLNINNYYFNPIEYHYLIFYNKINLIIDQFIGLQDDSYLKSFFLGLLYFLKGNYERAQDKLHEARPKLPPDSNLREYLDKIINDVLNNFNPAEVQEYTPILLSSVNLDLTADELTLNSNFIGTTAAFSRITHTINTRRYSNKRQLLQKLNKLLKESKNPIIITFGHSSQNGFALFKTEEGTTFRLEKSDIDRIFSKFENVVFIDNTCSDFHFSSPYSFGHSHHLIYPNGRNYSMRPVTVFLQGFFSNLKLTDDYYKAYIAGLFSLSVVYEEFENMLKYEAL